jgi:predicted transcriptional regulator
MRSKQSKDGRYRTKIEVLRDFLHATRQESKKTRIIGVANLNPASFQKYLDSCTRLDLVRETEDGYELTPRAEVVLDRIERLLEKSSETEAAFQALNRFLKDPSLSTESPPALRYVSRIAWSQVARPNSESGPPLSRTTPMDRSGGYPPADFKLEWGDERPTTEDVPRPDRRPQDETPPEETSLAPRRFPKIGSRR